MLLSCEITLEGKTTSALLDALDEVKRLIESGYTGGSSGNEDSDFSFSVSGEEEEEQGNETDGWVCPGCGAGPFDDSSDIQGHLSSCELVDGAGNALDADDHGCDCDGECCDHCNPDDAAGLVLAEEE